MTNAEQIRKAMDLVEAPAKSDQKPAEKNVKVNLETLIRDRRFIKGRYNFNKGFLTFQDIIDNPNPFIEKYRKEAQKDTSNLVTVMSGFKADPKFTDKEKYLRQGWESRGFSNNHNSMLIWFKDNKESLIIFAPSKDLLQEMRDFFLFFNVIRTN
jgi:hypothetical protein